MGIYNPKTGLTFNVRFSRESGDVGIVSQTGAGMMELIPHANARGVRFSKVVSYGNALDLNAPEFVEYLAHDNDTKYIFCYVEGVNDGYRFFKAVRDCNRTKPVIVLKGRTDRGWQWCCVLTYSFSGGIGIGLEGLLQSNGRDPGGDT